MKNLCGYLNKDVSLKDLYKNKPGFDFNKLVRFLDVVLGHEMSPPADRQILGVAHKSGASWVTQVYDCRSESRHHRNMTLIGKLAKDVSTTGRPHTFRMLHTNNEFSSARGLHTLVSTKNKGKAGPKSLVRRALTAVRSLPEPLENIATLVSKGYPMTSRPRRHVDTPGTTLCRGLSHVPMRQGYGDGKRLERNLWVTASVARTIMKGCVAPATKDEDEDSEDVCEGEEEEEECGARDEEEEEEEPVVPLVPWAKSEAVSREMINIYQVTHQVIFAGGEGEDAMAGVRERTPTLVLVRSAMHASVMKQHLVSTMMLEHADTIDDGFLFRKMLVRNRSVGGETIPDDKPLVAQKTEALHAKPRVHAQPKNSDDAQLEGKKNSDDAQPKNSDDSSSSSSDGDDDSSDGK